MEPLPLLSSPPPRLFLVTPDRKTRRVPLSKRRRFRSSRVTPADTPPASLRVGATPTLAWAPLHLRPSSWKRFGCLFEMSQLPFCHAVAAFLDSVFFIYLVFLGGGGCFVNNSSTIRHFFKIPSGDFYSIDSLHSQYTLFYFASHKHCWSNSARCLQTFNQHAAADIKSHHRLFFRVFVCNESFY